MKTGVKVRRVQLTINQNNESVILGIVSAEPDYKLSLTLNRKLKISLKNDSPVVAPDTPGSDLIFSRFADTSGSPDLSCDLISNRSGKNYLLKKLKNIDYIFLLHNPDNDTAINKIISNLKNTDGVTAVFKIDPESIKDKNLRYVIQ